MIYLYAKDLNKPNYQLLMKKREEAGMYLGHLIPKAFIEYSYIMVDFTIMLMLKSKKKTKIPDCIWWHDC